MRLVIWKEPGYEARQIPHSQAPSRLSITCFKSGGGAWEQRLQLLTGCLPKLQDLPPCLDDLLLPTSHEQAADVYVIGTQESTSSRWAWLDRLVRGLMQTPDFPMG